MFTRRLVPLRRSQICWRSFTLKTYTVYNSYAMEKLKDVRDHYLVEGLRFGDHDIPVTKDGQKVTVLYIRDLPYEVPSDDLVDFFSNYGEVLTVERSVAVNFPGLCNGNRILKLILNEDLPYFLSVCGYQCRVWYRGQPLQCLVCRERGHPAQSCPLSGRCRYCHQVGQRLSASLGPTSFCSC